MTMAMVILSFSRAAMYQLKSMHCVSICLSCGQ